ncbi:glycosyltransferase family 4 protein [Chryseotalea sanaruensis]|uniref:Glycosyltransferase family 4 protein n=1 Tax=Chryseotalea sanaruensis TaxID=2482724 RepID=A0A401U721_9BACT|nr:glycosyltransferase [Chryseotalea sanaruensis]GCC50606.1 glycosyltransferase family 4 protein [Chryseotalea sanaruensis]
MTILFLSSFPIDANKGGVQRVTETLALEFKRLEHSVIYLCVAEHAPVEVKGIPQYIFPDAVNKILNCQDYLVGLVDKLKIDVIINQASMHKQLLAILNGVAKRREKKVKIITVHHNCISCYLENYRNIVLDNIGPTSILKRFDYPFVWWLLKRYNKIKYGNQFKKILDISDNLVLLSPRFVAELKSYGVYKNINKVTAIPNPAPYRSQEGVEKFKENRLLYVGRLDYHQKRVDLLLDIWGRLQGSFPDWSFDILGDGPMRKHMQEKIAKLDLQRIILHGYADPQPFLQRSKFFCMTSAFEGFGMVLVEAQAYGVVPFAFNCYTGLQDIIVDKKSGMIFDKFDVDSYVKGLTHLMRNEDLRQEMASNAQEGLVKYYPENITDSWIKLMKQS